MLQGSKSKQICRELTESHLIYAGLNAIPLLEDYRRWPIADNIVLLQTMGAILGQLTNIDKHGQASMGFHGDPAIMRHDPYRYVIMIEVAFPRL